MPSSIAPLAQRHGAVAGEMASAVAVVAHRPLGRLLVVLGDVVSAAGLLDFITAATPAFATPSLTARASTPPGPTTSISDKRMGYWGVLLLSTLQQIVLCLYAADDLGADKSRLPTQFSDFEVVLGRVQGSNQRSKVRLKINRNTSVTHQLDLVF